MIPAQPYMSLQLKVSFWFWIFYLFFMAGFISVALAENVDQAGLELGSPACLPLPPKCWKQGMCHRAWP